MKRYLMTSTSVGAYGPWVETYETVQVPPVDDNWMGSAFYEPYERPNGWRLA